MRQMQEARFDEVRLDGLGSVHGRVGRGRRLLAVDAHIDTVDQGNLDNWSDPPFSGKIAGGFVYGRGSVDQKGGAAAMVTAGRILAELGLQNDLHGPVHRHGDGRGLRRPVLEIHHRGGEDPARAGDHHRADRPGHLPRPARPHGDRASASRGCRPHGSAPERGKNAIYMAARACLEIEKLNERLAADDFLGKGTITVSEFVSGSPLALRRRRFRPHPPRPPPDRAARPGNRPWPRSRSWSAGMPAAVEVLQYREKSYTGREYGMEKYYPTWTVDAGHPAVTRAEDVFRSLFKKEPRVDKWTFSTNAVTINGIYGIPTIGFGPGDEVFGPRPQREDRRSTTWSRRRRSTRCMR